jgi:SAM-dependent methyltransferase
MLLLDKVRGKIDAWRRARFMARVSRDNADFDRRYGVDTADRVELEDYDVAGSALTSAVAYSSTHEGVLRSILDQLGAHVTGWDFVDIGSGKGKALMVAAMYPFQSVRGVEISPRLTAAAERNIAILRSAGLLVCQDVASLCIDARTLPEFGQRTVLFVFNPFGEDLVRGVAAEVERQAGYGKSFVVVYLNPRAPRPFDSSPSLRRLVQAARLNLYATEGFDLPQTACAALERRFAEYRL